MNVKRLFKYEVGFSTKSGNRHYGLKTMMDVEKKIKTHGIKNLLFIKEFE